MSVVYKDIVRILPKKDFPKKLVCVEDFSSLNLVYFSHHKNLSLLPFMLHLLFCILLPFILFARSTNSPNIARWRESGVPYIQIYNTSDYKGGEQNWDIVQDRRGILFFANTAGLMEYDGVYWRHFRPEVSSYFQTLSIDTAGQIWLGGTRDFGYLKSDSIGQLQFVSLIKNIPISDRENEVDWRVQATSRGVYFFGHKVLVRWPDSSGTIKIWRSKEILGHSFVFNDTLYIYKAGNGLMQVDGDSLRLSKGVDRFRQIPIVTMLPYAKLKNGSLAHSLVSDDSAQSHGQQATCKQSFVVTSSHGLFISDSTSFQPFYTEADAYLQENIIMCAARLTDGSYALGTRFGGIVIIDQQGFLRYMLNKDNGLPDNTVYYMYLDTQGEIWLALNKGIAHFDPVSPFRYYHKTPGLSSGVEKILRHRGDLYATTASGLFVMKESNSDGTPPVFQRIPGIKSQCRQLLSAGKQLLVTSDLGIYQVENDQVRLIRTDKRDMPTWLTRSRYDTNLVYVGFKGGLGYMRLQAGKWQITGYAPGIHEIVEGIAEENPGSLWLSTRYGVVTHLRSPWMHNAETLDFSGSAVTRYDESQGLAKGWNKASFINGKILFTTDKGLRYFDSLRQTFPLDSSFGGLFADTTWSFGGIGIEIDNLGQVWTARSGQIGMASRKPDGSYSWSTMPFRSRAKSGGIWTFYIDEKYPGIYWFGGAEGIIRYDASIVKNYAAGYPALIRRVIVNGDSIIYGGAYNSPAATRKAATLPYENNTIRIEYAAPYYHGELNNEYQYYLEGFDDGWSQYTGETKVDYRKLPEGRYKFHVRAKNIYQITGGKSIFALEIQSPWYRTWWSYFLYGFMILGVLYAIRRYEMNRQGLKHSAELEHLETERLKELDKHKSDFYANISHEFRTPLTMILGPAEQMLEVQNLDDKKNLSLIRKNAQRLLQLIDQLLDLSKLESHSLKLQSAPGNILAFLKGLVMSFESLAERKGIDLQFVVNNRLPTFQDFSETYFDRDKIEKIITNLLSNAFKFTPEGGTIRVNVSVSANCPLAEGLEQEEQQFEILHPQCKLCRNATGTTGQNDFHKPEACLGLEISDTGEGIPAGQLPFIFNRFYQVDSSSRRTHGGAGIGLALVKELVEMHYGSIIVNSRQGAGTTFMISLPLGKDHLQPEQIAEIAQKDLWSAVDILDMEKDTTEQPCTVGSQTETADRAIVLIIEDNPDVRSYIRGQLQKEYTILEAEDGQQGIDRAIETIPDLVISDVMMPKKDGLEVCRTLKTDERTSHIPVILLTAKAGEQEKLLGLETGADAYVLKPFRQQELAVRVRKLIELRRKLRRRFSTATVIKPSEVEATPIDRAFLERVVGIIEARMGDEQFNAETLANEAAMSVSQLNRKLNALIDQPAGRFIRSMRLQRAADLLEKKSGTVAEICFMVGFSDQANFTRSFKKQFKCSPSEYQKTQQK